MSQQNFKYSTNSLISCCLYRMRNESFDISRRPHLEIPKPWNLEVLNAVKEAKKDSTLYFRFPNFFGLIFQKIWPIVGIFILLPMSCFLMGSLKSSSISLKRNELLYLLYILYSVLTPMGLVVASWLGYLFRSIDLETSEPKISYKQLEFNKCVFLWGDKDSRGTQDIENQIIIISGKKGEAAARNSQGEIFSIVCCVCSTN